MIFIMSSHSCHLKIIKKDVANPLMVCSKHISGCDFLSVVNDNEEKVDINHFEIVQKWPVLFRL